MTLSFLGRLLWIICILRTFELFSGLKINFAKSCFGAFGMNDQWKQRAANYLNCSQLVLPFVYLGIPIGLIRGELVCGNPLFKNVREG